LAKLSPLEKVIIHVVDGKNEVNEDGESAIRETLAKAEVDNVIIMHKYFNVV